MSKLKVLGVAVLVVGSIVLSAASGMFYYSKREIVEVKIFDTAIKRSEEDGIDKYLVYTNSEVFENVGDVWIGKLDSSDVQNQLIQAKQKICTIDVVGYRLHSRSVYRNVLRIEECRDVPAISE
jgi:Zn-dependent alcohol dehydrogenase